MSKRVYNSSLRKSTTNCILNDDYFVLFKNSLTENKIKQLNNQFKLYEKNGFITYTNYLTSMKNILDLDKSSKEYINHFNNNNIYKINESLDSDKSSSSESDKNEKSNIFDEIYDLIFERFREVKCIIKNNRNVFYLTDFRRENYISTYNVLCALTIFLQTSFDNKIKILFFLTDIDEDGYLNKKEIENMITTINVLFGEEINTINLNSSILSQSLVNIRVRNILNELLYNSGGLCNKLAEHQNYITFDIFYESIKKLKNYKYWIIPCFINIRDCLYSYKKEKMINVRDKYKKDFINISSSLVLEQNKIITEDNYKKFSLSNLNQILQPIKINKYLNNNKFRVKNKTGQRQSARIFRYDPRNRRSLLKSDKCLKDLINNSTILNEKIEKIKLKPLQKKKNSKIFQYAFQANYNDIRNIEVEPGLINFIPNEMQKNNENSIISLNKLITKSPEIRRKRAYNNGKGSHMNNINLFNSLNKVMENHKEENRRNLLRHGTNLNEDKLHKTKTFKPKLAQSLSSMNVLNFFNNKVAAKEHKEHTNSNHIKKKKNNIIRLTNNNFIKNNERYKTFEEIIQEIGKLEKKFNFESINNINNEMIKEYKEFQSEINNYKRNCLISDEKITTPFFVHKYRTFEANKNKNI